jgi:pyruvate dehydrogenase E1 component
MAAAELLHNDFGVAADVWSVTSWSELRRDGLEAERWNLLHPEESPRRAFATTELADRQGPVIASSDYVKACADMIRPFVPGRYVVLGTDGYGRSDRRSALRQHFEVDRHYVAVAALKALADDGALPPALVQQAIEKYGIDAERTNPARA